MSTVSRELLRVIYGGFYLYSLNAKVNPPLSPLIRGVADFEKNVDIGFRITYNFANPVRRVGCANRDLELIRRLKWQNELKWD